MIRRMSKMLLTVAFVFVGTGAFAIGFSGGAGANLFATSWNISATVAGTTATAKDAMTLYGASAFLDATYVQLSVGYVTTGGVTLSGNQVATTNYTESLGYLPVGVLLKYPFKLGPVVAFPLLGVEYDLNTSHGSPDYFEAGLVASPTSTDYNQLWIKGGIGADINISSQLYLRPELLYGIKPLTSDENNVVTSLQNAGATGVSLGYSTFDFSVFLGYRFQ